MNSIVPAHHQAMTLHVVASIPEHEPREGDPHYALFQEAKARLKRQGLWKCILGDNYCAGVPELHHSHLEFSQVNASDWRKVNDALGLHLKDDDEFTAWCEGPGNLEVLCSVHHRTHLGVHAIPGPLWEPMRYRKAGVEPPARYYTAAEWAALRSGNGSAATS